LVSSASEDDAISKAVNNSNITPILEAFDIKAHNEDENSYVIDVTGFVNGENPLLALSSDQKDAYKLTSLEKNKSYIKEINSFPINTEIKTVKTYKAKTGKDKRKQLPAAILAGVVTLEINNSFILLPKEPMRKRLYDERVGYFASSYLEYGDDQQKVDRNTYIHRWRLEPKPEDLLKFGLIPEFVGRLPVLATLEDLDEDALVTILTQPKNALVKQYQRLFELESTQLSFTDEALSAIAKRAIQRKTGARGLRSILEDILLNTMFELPGLDSVTEVVVNEEAVNSKAEPLMIHGEVKKESATAS
jgi:hypothetical protein